MVNEWMRLGEALDYVAQVVQSRENAKIQLLAKLQGASLAARCDELRTDNGSVFSDNSFATEAGSSLVMRDCEIPPAAWEGADIDWEADSFVRRHLEIDAMPGHPGRDLPGFTASGVRVSSAQLRRLFPLEPSSRADAPDAEPARRSGRPPSSGFAEADAPIVEKMRELIESGNCTSVTQAAWQVIGRDGSGAKGNGSPESKVDRLVKRYGRKTEKNRE